MTLNKKLIIAASIFAAGSAALFFLYLPGCNIRKEVVIVNGQSMNGLIEDGTEVALYAGYYSCHPIARGDIVAYQFSGNTNPIIKRVIAVPGDQWGLEQRADGAALFVAGIEQANSNGIPYRFNKNRARMLGLYRSPIPDGAYLILGNLPGGSTDSTVFGLASRNNIIGKIEF